MTTDQILRTDKLGVVTSRERRAEILAQYNQSGLSGKIWQPSTNMIGSDRAVWVPLRGVNWDWSGTATNTGSGWGLQSATNSSVGLTNDFNVSNEV